MNILVDTKPIAEAPLDTKEPLIVWLPNLRKFVSALPIFDIEGSVEGWTITDEFGERFGAILSEAPTFYVSGLNALALETGSASIPLTEEEIAEGS
jgi:hypothetical protein